MLFFFIFQNIKKHLYIYTYTHVKKKKKKKKNNSFVAVFRNLVETLMSVAKWMMSVFSIWSGGPFFERSFKTQKRGCSMRAHPHASAQCQFSCVLARFILRVDKLHILAKKMQQTRNLA